MSKKKSKRQAQAARRAKAARPAVAVPAAPASERWLTLCAWGAALALFAALAWPFLNGLIYAGDDLDHFHLPLRQFYWQCLHDGDSFDWLPNLFCGFYLTGEGQIGTYHPLHLALYRLLPLELAFNLDVLLSYPFMFGGMVLLLRRVGSGGRAAGSLPMHAALFGAMLFTFSGFCLLHFMHMNGIAIVAHIPWLLWTIDLLVRGETGRWRVCGWLGIGLFTASQLLLGYPQYVWMSSLTELFWLWLATRNSMLFAQMNDIPADTLTPALSQREREKEALTPALSQGEREENSRRVKLSRMLAWYVAAKVLAVLLGAIQLLPTYDHLMHSQREASGQSVGHFSPLHPLNIVQLVAPYLLNSRVEGGNTHEFGLYAGAIPLLLLAWLVARRRDLGESRRAIKAVAAFGLLAFVMALGRYGGLYYLQTLLPIVGNFRVPARYIVLVHLSVAILAAAAFAQITDERTAMPRPKWRHAWKLAGFSLSAAILLRVLLSAERVSTLNAALAGPALMLIATVVAVFAAAGRRWAWTAVVLLTAADIGYYGMSYVVFPGSVDMQQIREHAPQPTADGSRLATNQPNERGQFTGGNLWMLNGARLSDGYAGLLPASRLDFRAAATLRLANVSQVFTNSGTIAPLRDPLPRVSMVSRAAVSENPAEDLAKMPAESLGAIVLVETPVQLDGLPGEARLQLDRPGNLEILADTPGTQMLVIADRFHEGWQADVDDQPQPVYRAYGDFMGVVVPPGEHVVRLRFEPQSLVRGRLCTAIGAVIWGLCLLVGIVRTGRS